jgi:hypothetical protein
MRQHRGTGPDASTPEAVRSIAERGLAGANQPLPHAERLQAAFGHHDISSVTARVGGSAKDASTALGAEAYTAGQRVAFRGSPDLETAAHEAAHVVQQRAGVNLPDGLSRPGDAYERHADEVAQRVVQGRSVESLLDQMAPTSGSTTLPHEAGIQQLASPEQTPAQVAVQATGALSVQRKAAKADGEASIGPDGVEAAMGGTSKENAEIAKAAKDAKTAKPLPAETAKGQIQSEGDRTQNVYYQSIRELLEEAEAAAKLGNTDEMNRLIEKAREWAKLELDLTLKALDSGTDSTNGIRDVLNALSLVLKLGGNTDVIEPTIAACLEVAMAQMERAFSRFEANRTKETAVAALNKAALGMKLGETDRTMDVALIIMTWAKNNEQKAK